MLARFSWSNLAGCAFLLSLAWAMVGQAQTVICLHRWNLLTLPAQRLPSNSAFIFARYHSTVFSSPSSNRTLGS